MPRLLVASPALLLFAAACGPAPIPAPDPARVAMILTELRADRPLGAVALLQDVRDRAPLLRAVLQRAIALADGPLDQAFALLAAVPADAAPLAITMREDLGWTDAIPDLDVETFLRWLPDLDTALDDAQRAAARAILRDYAAATASANIDDWVSTALSTAELRLALADAARAGRFAAEFERRVHLDDKTIDWSLVLTDAVRREPTVVLALARRTFGDEAEWSKALVWRPWTAASLLAALRGTPVMTPAMQRLDLLAQLQVPAASDSAWNELAAQAEFAQDDRLVPLPLRLLAPPRRARSLRGLARSPACRAPHRRARRRAPSHGRTRRLPCRARAEGARRSLNRTRSSAARSRDARGPCTMRAMRRVSLLSCVVLFAACATSPSVRGDDVYANGALAARFVHPEHDPAHHLDTCKVFHHVYAPDGRLLTKGIGGEFPHHRGLFLGWNVVRVAGKQFDFWHCSHGETLRFDGYAAPAALGLDGEWQVASISWRDGKDAIVVRELRALRATALAADVTRLDVEVELQSDRAVQLGGDPQHSGHQFRALQAFAEKDAARVRYVRPPEARSEPDDIWTGCDWIAAVLPLPGSAVTVLRVEDARNPPQPRWSTRDYGRFGATNEIALRPGVPVRLRYRYLIALGELSGERCAQLAAAAR